MPNAQLLPRILHLYSLVLFFLLTRKSPSLALVNKVFWIWISWRGANEQFNSKFVYFDCYLNAYQKKLNFIYSMIQSCRHFPKKMFTTKHAIEEWPYVLSFSKRSIPEGIFPWNQHLLVLNGHGSHVMLKTLEQTQ